MWTRGARTRRRHCGGQARGVGLHSIHAYPTVEAQVARFQRAGFDHSTAVDRLTAYRRHIPPQEHLR